MFSDAGSESRVSWGILFSLTGRLILIDGGDYKGTWRARSHFEDLSGCPFLLRLPCLCVAQNVSPFPRSQKITQRLWEPGRDLLRIRGYQNMRDGYKKIEILATFPLIFARRTRDSGDVFDFSQWTAEKGWSQSHLSFTSHECQLAVEVSSYRFYKVDCEWKVFSFKCKRIGQCKAGMSQSCNCWEPVAMNVCSLQAGQYLLVKDIMCHGYPHLGLNFDYSKVF